MGFGDESWIFLSLPSGLIKRELLSFCGESVGSVDVVGELVIMECGKDFESVFRSTEMRNDFC